MLSAGEQVMVLHTAQRHVSGLYNDSAKIRSSNPLEAKGHAIGYHLLLTIKVQLVETEDSGRASEFIPPKSRVLLRVSQSLCEEEIMHSKRAY